MQYTRKHRNINNFEKTLEKVQYTSRIKNYVGPSSRIKTKEKETERERTATTITTTRLSDM